MPDPKEVYDNPPAHWDFITSSSDDDFEGQHFDRKEAGRVGDNGFVSKSSLNGVRDQIKECTSAFANANQEGGLLAVGISSTGEVKGTNHLQENQLNSLTSFRSLLRNQAAVARLVDCENSAGDPDQVLLIYTPYAENDICETLTSPPQAWLRIGKQNVPVNDQVREQLKRDKRILDFERAYCCPFDVDQLDKDVLTRFRQEFLADAAYDYSDEELLHQAGAIDRGDSGYTFNNAGFLFFAARPQRVLDWAYMRLLRFEVDSNDADSQSLHTFEKKFDGSIPQQIRKIRAFFRESGFFKTYKERKPDGGFVDVPEFPHIAVDEAIVNAVAHRDYGVQLPIECIHYKDAFVIENPGRVLQRDQDLPSEFSLDMITLNSMPRNSRLIEWLKIMRDEDGAQFVRAISEGTRRMQREMEDAGLPAPHYRISSFRTTATLLNNVVEREARYKATSALSASTQFANLFPLKLLTDEGEQADIEFLRNRRKDFTIFLEDALRANGWYIDHSRYGRLTAHRKGSEINLPSPVRELVRFYPAYTIQLREYWGQFYLCVDYTLEVKSPLKADKLLHHLTARDLKGRTAVAQFGDWQRGKITGVNTELTHLYLFDLGREESIASNKVIPDLPIELIKQVLDTGSVRFDLSREMKRHSLALEPGAAPKRAERTIATVQQMAKSVFPLTMDGLRAILVATPEPLYQDGEEGTLTVQTLKEPVAEFKRHRESPNIREGISGFGAYEDTRKELELVPICTDEMRESMATLIERLKAGRYKYLGSERTFSTRLSYGSIITVRTPEDIQKESERLLGEHPDWIGDKNLNRLFLVHTPEAGYSRDDENSPYYRVKRLLLEQGIPCQMVDTPTLLNPDWKDLNLALNIVAKCGVTPWVLPESIPDADFFIGLSYTRSRKRGRVRLVGYATVFNQFGNWQFFLGNTEAFSYEERVRYFASLTKETLEHLALPDTPGTLSDTPSIYFHYSARFSGEDREAILRAARSVRPNGTYSFVSINSHHNIRLYDSRAETDGSLSRGSYVVIGPKQILISTTGYNPYRKALGTPKPLEVTIWTERPKGVPDTESDLKSLAVQILSLTKLNWASTDSLCGEPITTKYAGDIAYLTDAFLKQTGTFRLHPVLAETPWFI